MNPDSRKTTTGGTVQSNSHGDSEKRFSDVNRQLTRIRDEIALIDERINARKPIVPRTLTSAASTEQHRSNVVEIQPQSTESGQNDECLALFQMTCSVHSRIG